MAKREVKFENNKFKPVIACSSEVKILLLFQIFHGCNDFDSLNLC